MRSAKRLGGDFSKKTATRYTLLADVFPFFPTIAGCFKKFLNFLFRFGRRTEGNRRGELPNRKHLI